MGSRNDSMSGALFNYRVRESSRARQVCLRVTPEHGLEVVVPPGFNPARIPVLLAQKQRWISRALERAAQRRALLGADLPWALPAEIHLAALERRWQVLAQPVESGRVTLRELGHESLRVRGCIDDEAACRHALLAWLRRQAQRHLTPQLHALSHETALTFQRVSFRHQRSRWGSCSRHGAISLNAKLLFLPPSLVRYVMAHELCHRKHMNHSVRFWTLLERLHPGARADDRALRHAWRLIPRWAG
jgi:predicted metal-dependent hydrolase